MRGRMYCPGAGGHLSHFWERVPSSPTAIFRGTALTPGPGDYSQSPCFGIGTIQFTAWHRECDEDQLGQRIPINNPVQCPGPASSQTHCPQPSTPRAVTAFGAALMCTLSFCLQSLRKSGSFVLNRKQSKSKCHRKKTPKPT